MKTLITLFFLLLSTANAFAFGSAHREPTPEQTLEEIYRPWGGPLRKLEQLLKPGKNYIVWIDVPAQHPVDIRSGDSFRKWLIATPLTEISVSHQMLAWSCLDKDGRAVTGATGMTGVNSNQHIQMMLRSFGLSFFFSTFTDAVLDPSAEVESTIVSNAQARGAAYIGFEVTREQCDAMQAFLADFVHRPQKPFTRYGFALDADKMEGGNCASFAAAMLKNADILTPVLPLFRRSISVLRWLMGGNLGAVKHTELPELPWLEGKQNPVAYVTLLTESWENPGDGLDSGKIRLVTMDPEKVLYAMKQFANVYLETLPENRRREEATYLESTPLGLRTVVSADFTGPNAREAALKTYTKFRIDDAFDPETASVGAAARNWVRQKMAGGFHLRRATVDAMPVLFLERDY